jgi:DMSO/TMAO reductase YedYZ molybdopterin-dependent catalytic subunit
MVQPHSPGRIVRQKVPLNVEFQFAALSGWLTPNDQFYIRNHFPTPRLDGSAWGLTVGGAVDNPLRLSLDDLRALPPVTLTAVMECAGNGRVFYEPAKEGLQWQAGAVGNAAWTGVRLRDVLERAGVRQEAVEVVLVGGDRGVIDGGKKTASPGPIAFARSLPLAKAMSDAVVLAYEMNGEPLTPDHGFPLRAVVGGWFGMAWVKWLAEIRVVERPFLGYWQARDYFRWDRSQGEPALVPLESMEVKAQIARPVQGATVTVGRPVRIVGAAWSGEARIAQVLVSTGDDAWREAALLDPEADYAWRLWEHAWVPPQAGVYCLRCRAIDAAGNVQPDTQQPDRESYVANWSIPVEVNAVEPDGPDGPDYVI